MLISLIAELHVYRKNLLITATGKRNLQVDRITVFAVNVTNAKSHNVSENVSVLLDVKDLSFSAKSLNALVLCIGGPITKKDLLLGIGVTNQTINLRNIINPLIASGCIAPISEDRNRTRNIRYEITARGRDFVNYRSIKTNNDSV